MYGRKSGGPAYGGSPCTGDYSKQSDFYSSFSGGGYIGCDCGKTPLLPDLRRILL